MLFLDNKRVTVGKFPNQETYVDFDELLNLDVDAWHEITCMFESNDDLINLMFLKRSMDDMGFLHVGLFIPYLPYAGLDRTENTRCLGAKFVGNFINGLDFGYVRTWEAHSNVILAVTDRIEDRLVSVEIAEEVAVKHEAPFYVFPDAGARKRYEKLASGRYMSFEKARRFEDGKLGAPRLAEDRHGDGMTAIIVDDLCRGGRTVSNVADEIARLVPDCKIVFCCAHTEKTVYKGVILDNPNVRAIYTTDSLLGDQILHEKLKIVKRVRDEAS